jgi:diguanylate cyclase (GGDEF)-like protein/PAS domain S-box-containing protein
MDQVQPEIHAPDRPLTGLTAQQFFDRLIAHDSPDLHVLTRKDGTCCHVSPACQSLLGWQPEQLVGSLLASFIHPDDAGALDESLTAAGENPSASVVTVARFRCEDGTYRWTESLARRVEGPESPLVLSAVRDIGERKRAEFDLELRATTDPLTGVANRTVFRDRLQQALRRLERREGLVGVLFLDLDRFKLINDSLGHQMGDTVLLKMADRLRGFLRPQDTLARLGGDEFAILVEDLVVPDALIALGTRIVEAARVPFSVGEEQFVCTASIGIAFTPDKFHSAESLLQEADLALYRAKNQGRDRAELFEEGLRSRLEGRLATERMLRRAIAEDRLRIEYQPVVDLATDSTVAVEALVRVWDADEGGLIPAESFIGIAEEAGLLTVMDNWMLEQALQQAATWRALFVDTAFADVAINVTARRLADPAFAQSVLDLLAARELPTAVLQIEVTERVLMESSKSAMSGLHVLRAAGVKVGLDDYGTGYTSLSSLRNFPLDFVKVDRSFIRQLLPGTAERAIVASIIELAHALGMSVVAEGVETAFELEQLKLLGCDRAQGFLFATAGPPRVIEQRVLQTF